ncbi:hypothetical protein BCR33DRAFT_173131 [Rhizoclosmatium globosum]|uniref:Uncharacterized protein n=1 Tax=Rhizoclosmatium globosum TaxID=329046 RepID=A0A1Y2CF70_9FUNG|nr:hypothetical protein BCR33DRAFT_173131 [Rhizoclosmatium globosum]|eukprot:ORY45713.1 hypothetical protein BCR33DRAFT_173131 [Rhizoclosmatium globosum]
MAKPNKNELFNHYLTLKTRKSRTSLSYCKKLNKSSETCNLKLLLGVANGMDKFSNDEQNSVYQIREIELTTENNALRNELSALQSHISQLNSQLSETAEHLKAVELNSANSIHLLEEKLKVTQSSAHDDTVIKNLQHQLNDALSQASGGEASNMKRVTSLKRL